MKAKINNFKYLIAVFFTILFVSCNDQNAAAEEKSTGGDDINVALTDALNIIAMDSCKNLQIFLIGGTTGINDKEYVTLNVAMEKEYITVHETSDVNELAVTNNSQYYIFIHGGDIVKGGRQDRTLAYDVIIPPKAKDIPLASFCVESGRWAPRGDEESTYFSANTDIVSSRDLKVASKYAPNQSAVWGSVDEQQKALTENVSMLKGEEINVSDSISATSLQLTLENDDLNELQAEYREKLQSLLEKHPEAIGYAYAVNGEVYGVDIYNSKKLFVDLWEKLLKACIVEAIGMLEKDKEFTPALGSHVKDLIEKAEKGEIEKQKINSETLLISKKAETAASFTTIDTDLNLWVHKNYISVDPDKVKSYENNNIMNEGIQQIQYNNLDEYQINTNDDGIEQIQYQFEQE